MPTYAYHCEECATRFEVRKSMLQRDSETPCPACGTTHTQRMISTVAVFAASANGQRQALAGAPSCAGCGLAATGCTSCGPR